MPYVTMCVGYSYMGVHLANFSMVIDTYVIYR